MAEEDLLLRAKLQDELSQGLRNIRREVERTDAAAAGLGLTTKGKTAPGLEAATKATSNLRTEASKANQTLITMSRSLGNEVVQDAKRGALALGGFTVATGLFGLKSASDFQTSRIAFQTLLGDVVKGNRLFDQLQTLNVKTPFQLSEIAPATQLLLRYGVAGDQVVGILKSLMDAAALSGAPAENLQRLALATGQVISQGRILGQDARQLAESGINVYDLVAQKMGITQAAARKLGEEGKLSSDILVQGLLNYEGPLAKLQGGAEKLSGTLFGQLSNLKDAVRVRLADTASPLTEQLTKDMPTIVKLAGDFAEDVGAPIFRIFGKFADFGVKGLPLIEHPLTALLDGFGRILDVGAPALNLLSPVSDQLSNALVQLVTELLPNVPDIVAFFVGLVGVLPDVVRLLGDLIPLAMPLLHLATGLLEFGPARTVLAGLLITLLAYSKIAALVSGLRSFATALGIIGDEAALSGVKADIAYGKLAALGAIAGGAALALPELGNVTSGKASAGSTAKFIAGTTLAGAGIGSIVPGVGTAVGAVSGAALGAGYSAVAGLFGDPVVPGAIASRHSAANAGQGASMRRITSGVRGHSVRSSSSGHVRGTAVDVAGPGLTGYVQRVRQQGGWAVLEGAGAGMHAHADFGDPAARTGTSSGSDWAGGGGGAPVHIHIGQVVGQVDFERGVERAMRRVDEHRRTSAYTPVFGR